MILLIRCGGNGNGDKLFKDFGAAREKFTADQFQNNDYLEANTVFFDRILMVFCVFLAWKSVRLFLPLKSAQIDPLRAYNGGLKVLYVCF